MEKKLSKIKIKKNFVTLNKSSLLYFDVIFLEFGISINFFLYCHFKIYE